MLQRIGFILALLCFSAAGHAETDGPPISTNYELKRIASAVASNVPELVNAQTGTSYTFVTGDGSKLVNFSNTSAIAVTLPQATSSGNFATGWHVDVQNINTGLVTITPTTSTINGASSFILPKGYGVRIVSDGTNYQIAGFNPLQGHVLLNTLTASSSASLSDTTSLTSAFTHYDIVFTNVIPATNEVACEIEVYTGGAFKTSGYNAISSTAVYGGSSYAITGTTTYIPCALGNTAANDPSNAEPGISGTITVANPSANQQAVFYGSTSAFSGGGDTANYQISGMYQTAGAVTGFEVLMASGNITSGTIEIYGWN